MELQKARVIAEDVVSKLRPFSEKIAIVGSIRRQKSMVHDVDIVAIPSNQGQFQAVLQGLGRIKTGGGKRISVGMGFTKGIDLDLYIATAETWYTLMLIRTGSASHNIRLCTRAKNMGMKLHADGSGLFRIEAQGCEGVEVRIAGDSEESIFEKLELPYEEPEVRE